MSKRRKLKKVERDSAAINRTGGRPIGIGSDNWPHAWNPETEEDQPMVHLLTIATEDIDADVRDSVVALALFMSSPEMPFYFDDPTADFVVIQLTQEDIDRGELDVPELAAPALEATGLEVLDSSTSGMTFAGGEPVCIQEEGSPDGFVLQFDDRFLNVNLGDSGRLYMYTSWAYWDCY